MIAKQFTIQQRESNKMKKGRLLLIFGGPALEAGLEAIPAINVGLIPQETINDRMAAKFLPGHYTPVANRTHAALLRIRSLNPRAIFLFFPEMDLTPKAFSNSSLPGRDAGLTGFP